MKCPICDGMGTSNTCVNGTFKPCSFCGGTGEVMTDDVKIRCDDCKFVENCVDYGWQECRKFTPKPSEPMTKLCNTCEYLKYCARSGVEKVGCDRYKKDMTTNEEWFCNLSTEEKAEWLSKHLHCGDCNIENRMCAGTYSGCKETLIKWLKEKHNG